MTNDFKYLWYKKNANFTKDKGKVFSCFSCGGGSSFGYKLAGFDVIGFNEIDKRMAEVYNLNHSVKYQYIEPIQSFKLRDDLPEELYNLDILDGSPPCSSFSMIGVREKKWGKKTHFAEGQAKQVLDTLFFDFIYLAKKLQPKVVIAENVKGLLLGNAKAYVARIYKEFEDAGYYCQHFLLNGAKMGLPQSRERVFFICLRKDIAKPFLTPVSLFDESPFIKMEFNEPPIPMGAVADFKGPKIKGKVLHLWNNRRRSDMGFRDITQRLYNKETWISFKLLHLDRPAPTLTTGKGRALHFEKPLSLSREEICKISSFPLDYDFGRYAPSYICGMSVPPLMMARVATEVYSQWLKHINNKTDESNKHNKEA